MRKIQKLRIGLKSFRKILLEAPIHELKNREKFWEPRKKGRKNFRSQVLKRNREKKLGNLERRSLRASRAKNGKNFGASGMEKKSSRTLELEYLREIGKIFGNLERRKKFKNF